MVFAQSCTSVQIPLEDDFNYVHRKKYVIDEYDCSNKSAEYLTILHKKGFTDSRIWTYNYTVARMYLASHAVVEVNGIFLDPTTGYPIKDIQTEYIKKHGYTISFNELQKLIIKEPSEWAF